MGARPVVTDILFHLELLKLADDPGAAKKTDDQSGKDGQNGPKRNIPEDVKGRNFVMQGIEYEVKHRLEFPSVCQPTANNGILGCSPFTPAPGILSTLR